MKWLKFKNASKEEMKLNKAKTITSIVGTIVIVVTTVIYVIWYGVKSVHVYDEYFSALRELNK